MFILGGIEMLKWWKDCDVELPEDSGYYRTIVCYDDNYSSNLNLKSVVMFYNSKDKDFIVCNSSVPFRYTNLREDYRVTEILYWRYNILRNLIDLISRPFKGTV